MSIFTNVEFLNVDNLISNGMVEFCWDLWSKNDSTFCSYKNVEFTIPDSLSLFRTDSFLTVKGGIGGQMDPPSSICQGGWGNGMWGGLAPIRPCNTQYLP